VKKCVADVKKILVVEKKMNEIKVFSPAMLPKTILKQK
jgi:hypothetical protein